MGETYTAEEYREVLKNFLYGIRSARKGLWCK